MHDAHIDPTTGEILSPPHDFDALRDRLAYLPETMRNARRWLLWAPGKVPHYASGGRRHGTLDGPEDVARLATLDDVLDVLDARYAGIGFALGHDAALGLHWQGLDLDDALDANGRFTTERARKLYDLTEGYAEISPSGRGLHVIGLGAPFRAIKWSRPGEQAIEMYSGARFFTVSGRMMREGDPVDMAPLAERVRAGLVAAGQQREHKARERVNGSAAYLDRMPENLRIWVRAHPIEAALAEHAYQHIGERWLSPRSESGIPGVAVLDEHRAVTFHASDAGIGTPTSGADGEVFNAFDCEVRYRYGDDRNRALRELLPRTRQEDAGGAQTGSEDVGHRHDADTHSEPPDEPQRDRWLGDGSIGHYLRALAPPVAWFAHERLLAGRAHLLTGIGGSSKTRTLYHLGIAAVLGRLAWDWQIDRTGSALLILSEDTADTVHRTLAAMRSAMQWTDAELDVLDKHMRVHGLAGKSSHLLMAAPGGVLEQTFRVDELLDEIRSLPQPVAFVGLDPAIGLSEGDELNAAHQRRLGELVDRVAIETGACVMLSTHSAKSLRSADEIGSHTSRGSGAITDAVRGEFALRTMTTNEARAFGIADPAERAAHVQLLGVKGNELPPSAFVPIWLRRGSGGVLYPVSLEPQPEATIGKRETAALDELRTLAATGAPTLKAWRQACADAALLTGPTDRAREKAMERIRDALLGAGLIERGVGRGVFVPAKAEETA